MQMSHNSTNRTLNNTAGARGDRFSLVWSSIQWGFVYDLVHGYLAWKVEVLKLVRDGPVNFG